MKTQPASETGNTTTLKRISRETGIPLGVLSKAVKSGELKPSRKGILRWLQTKKVAVGPVS